MGGGDFIEADHVTPPITPRLNPPVRTRQCQVGFVEKRQTTLGLRHADRCVRRGDHWSDQGTVLGFASTGRRELLSVSDGTTYLPLFPDDTPTPDGMSMQAKQLLVLERCSQLA